MESLIFEVAHDRLMSLLFPFRCDGLEKGRDIDIDKQSKRNLASD